MTVPWLAAPSEGDRRCVKSTWLWAGLHLIVSPAVPEHMTLDSLSVGRFRIGVIDPLNPEPMLRFAAVEGRAYSCLCNSRICSCHVSNRVPAGLSSLHSRPRIDACRMICNSQPSDGSSDSRQCLESCLDSDTQPAAAPAICCCVCRRLSRDDAAQRRAGAARLLPPLRRHKCRCLSYQGAAYLTEKTFFAVSFLHN